MIKRWMAALALGLMLTCAGAATVWATEVVSPEGTISGDKDPKESESTIDGDKDGDRNGYNIPNRNLSPKTSDFNIVYVEGLGLILVGAAAAAGVASRRYG